MDRDWMYQRLYSSKRVRQSFIDGVYDFVSKAMNQEQYALDGGIRCPCYKCRFLKIAEPSHVRAHLLRNGFQADYTIWANHGEDYSSHASSSQAPLNDGYQFQLPTEMIQDAYMQINDWRNQYHNVGSEGLQEGQEPNEEAKKFFEKLSVANEPIFDGATESTLSVVIRLLGGRINYHTTQSALDYFIQLLLDVAPQENTIPKNYYEAKKIVSSLGLKAVKIDCCQVGCMLYYKDDADLTECKFCSQAQYLLARGQNRRHKRVHVKRMFYLPIIPRLQRLFASMESAKQMRWHFENVKYDGVLRHLSDGQAWKHFDKVYPEFAIDPRNVRLGLCSDGFTPYIQASASPYSCWPVFVTPYNLPPEMCMTKPYMFLSCIIPEPTNPTKLIDVYLQPLIDDLQVLWSEGVYTYDISSKENFVLRACLMWTINDFPAYGMLSGWERKGS